ncbi:MAG TPA: replicative DNA helicase [Acidimicrobiales bacterium]|nr:replicative DNA helicase [Acidimicrobiales bacterium]
MSARPLPNDLAAEQALLGAMLLSRDAITAAAEQLRPDDFYRPAHGHIFDAMIHLETRGEPVDPVTVVDELRRTDLLAAAGGPEVAGDLVSLQANTPAISNAPRYARIVADLAVLRRLVGAGAEVAEIGYTPTDDVAGAVDAAEALVFGLGASRRSREELRTLGETLAEWYERMDARSSSGELAGVPTGWQSLDRMLLGLHRGQLITVAGRPGMGKSAVAAWLSVGVARTTGPVLVVNVEMSLAELQDRYVAAQASVDLQAVRAAKMAPADWDRLHDAVGRLEGLPLHVEATADVGLLGIRALARRVASRHGGQLALVIVDYLQLVTPAGRQHESRQVDVAEISRGLKRMALELDVPVVALAQLHRGVEARAEKRPMLADLRESGAIENDSDVVAFLYRAEYYDPHADDAGVLEVIVAKQRNGPTGTVKLAYDARYGRIHDLARQEAF